MWRLVLVYFLIQVGFYGLNLWLPHLVKDTIGGSYLVVGAITAIPYLFAIVGLWINARSADRTGRYPVHVMASLAIGAVALVLSVASGSIVALSVFLVSIAMAGALAYDGPFWASASRAVPVALAGGAMGLINALGNLGGFVGPYCRRLPAGRQRRQFPVDRGGARGRAGARRPGHADPAQAGRQARARARAGSRRAHSGQRLPRHTGPELPAAGDGAMG